MRRHLSKASLQFDVKWHCVRLTHTESRSSLLRCHCLPSSAGVRNIGVYDWNLFLNLSFRRRVLFTRNKIESKLIEISCFGLHCNGSESMIVSGDWNGSSNNTKIEKLFQSPHKKIGRREWQNHVSLFCSLCPSISGSNEQSMNNTNRYAWGEWKEQYKLWAIIFCNRPPIRDQGLIRIGYHVSTWLPEGIKVFSIWVVIYSDCIAFDRRHRIVIALSPLKVKE